MKGQIGLSLAVFSLIVIACVGLVVILNYNGIVKAQKAVEGESAQVESVLQRRLDLIPNIVETVKGYAKHEKETLEAITKARDNAQLVLSEMEKGSLTKENITALSTTQGELSRAMKSIFALVENYPDLKANTSFLALQDQLEGTENRINVARQRYNSSVRYYNSKINTFPGNIFAPMFGFQEQVYFEAKEEAHEPVSVKF